MFFIRSVPPRAFKVYKRYRPRLRKDFQFCCAYCLRPEANFGGEAGGDIDHFRPKELRPDLEAVYENLYWSCRECNSNKSSDWPTDQQLVHGERFVDPCTDELEDQYIFHHDGRIESLTPAAKYTIEHLLLDRDALNYWRRETIEAFRELKRVEDILNTTQLSHQVHSTYRTLVNELRKKIEPPVFDRAYKKQK